MQFSCFPVLPGSAEVQVIWDGTIKRLLIAYFIGNISAKKYQNAFTYVKVIANQRWDVFQQQLMASFTGAWQPSGTAENHHCSCNHAVHRYATYDFLEHIYTQVGQLSKHNIHFFSGKYSAIATSTKK